MIRPAPYAIGIPALVATAAIVACGDDDVVAPPSSAPDAGETSPTPEGDHDGGVLPKSDGEAARPPTCAGRPFGAITSVSVTSVDGGADAVVMLRPATSTSGVVLAGTAGYYVKRASGVTKLFRGSFVPPIGTAPATLRDAQPLVVTAEAESDTSPAVARDGSFLIFAHNTPGKLWSAIGSPSGTFVSPANASGDLLAFNGDDGEPSLAGNPSRALYWSRATQAGGARRIQRAKVLPQSGAAPKFEALGPVGSPCADGYSCGGPAVSGDETTMLFWTSKVSAFEPKIQEVLLTPGSAKENTVTSGTTVIEHPELGARIPGWLSDDGCEVVVSRDTTAQLGYAKRLPQ